MNCRLNSAQRNEVTLYENNKLCIKCNTQFACILLMINNNKLDFAQEYAVVFTFNMTFNNKYTVERDVRFLFF